MEKRIFLVFIIISAITSAVIHADEGMWMPHQMRMLNLQQQGLEMDPDDLYKEDGSGLISAIVDLGGGTASFVSEQGLMVTNHHVAFGALQRASDPKHNYLQDGFLAQTFEQEIQAPGYTAGVLLKYEDVTNLIESQLQDDMSPMERYKTIDLAKKKLVKEAESAGEDIYAEVAAAYSGNEYYLFIYKRIKDVRIVYAPPRDLGNFGGQIDNWMWPRHTCDFTFLRAYVSPMGIGVDYHPDNVPYQPEVYLKVDKNGIKEGDFTFIMGYPGKTYRNYSLAELLFDIEKMKKSIEARKQRISFFEEVSQKSKAIEIKYASMLKGLYNGLKNYGGKLEGFDKINLIDKKKEIIRAFEDWVAAEPDRQQMYNDVLSRLNNYLEFEYQDFYWKQNTITNLTYYRYGAALLSQAHTLVRIAIESQKPDMERDVYYQERNLPRLRKRIELAERRYDLEVDRDYTILLFKKLFDLPSDNQPRLMEKILEKYEDVENWANDAFKSTRLDNAGYRLSLIGKAPDELKAIDDPLLNIAFELENELSEMRTKKHEMDQQLKDLKKWYIRGLLEMRKGQLASDANSTIRFTYGPVKGYKPKDAVVYYPITTLSGVIEKDRAEPPFRVPNKMKELFREKDFGNYESSELGDVPTCFLNTTNVTGGNSGSPTLNARGELTGLVFDMTYESVIGDYYIIPQLQRSINVDIRYVLFVADKFSGAKALIEELGM